MGFNKFDPHKPVEPEVESNQGRMWLLRWGWWISVGYTALGFGFIAYWYATGQATL